MNKNQVFFFQERYLDVVGSSSWWRLLPGEPPQFTDMHASSLCLVCGTPNGIGYTGASLAFMVQSSFLLIIYCNTWALGINQYALKIFCHWQHCHLRPTRLHFGCGNGGRCALNVLGFGLYQSLFQHWMQAPSHKKRKTAAYLWPPDMLTNMAGRSSKETQSWSSPSSPTSIGIVR